MLKYTLGALAAAVILGGVALAVALQVTNGGADQGAAPVIIVSASDSEVWPLDLFLKEDQIIELQLNNQSSRPRSLFLDDASVEQLPQAPTHDGPVRASDDGIRIDAGPGVGDFSYVRFRESGEYTLYVGFTGTYYPPVPVRVVVE